MITLDQRLGSNSPSRTDAVNSLPTDRIKLGGIDSESGVEGHSQPIVSADIQWVSEVIVHNRKLTLFSLSGALIETVSRWQCRMIIPAILGRVDIHTPQIQQL